MLAVVSVLMVASCAKPEDRPAYIPDEEEGEEGLAGLARKAAAQGVSSIFSTAGLLTRANRMICRLTSSRNVSLSMRPSFLVMTRR